MIRLPPRSTRTYTLFPFTTHFRSHVRQVPAHSAVGNAECGGDLPLHRPNRVVGRSASYASVAPRSGPVGIHARALVHRAPVVTDRKLRQRAVKFRTARPVVGLPPEEAPRIFHAVRVDG